MTHSAWSDFWSSEQNMSIQGEGSKAVNEILSNVWLSNINELLEQNMICFDLASGSGFLSNLVSQDSANKTPLVFAYDYAKVNHRLYLASVKIIDKQPIETITSTNNKADIVMSNFGFEYANIDKAFASMIEYTHKGTYVLLNCHHLESAYSKDGKDIVSAYKELSNSGLLEHFSKILALKDPVQKNQQAMIFFQDASIIDKRNGEGLSKMKIVDLFLHFYQINTEINENLDHFAHAIEQQNNYITRLEHQLQAAANYPVIIDHLKMNSSLFDIIKEQDVTFNGHLISKFITAKIK